MDKIVFNIPKDLKKEFQILTLTNDTNITNVLLDFVKEYINAHK